MKPINVLGLIGSLAIVGAISAGAFFLGGFYSVAANQPDPEVVNLGLIRVREASIARHATAQPPSSLDDPASASAGARAYSQLGCTNCHGAPGVTPARFSEGLNPPPNLKAVIKEGLPPQELFWVIKNGIKMTGMPSFGDGPTPVPDDEIWNIVGYLKKLPNVSNEEFKAWSTGLSP